MSRAGLFCGRCGVSHRLRNLCRTLAIDFLTKSIKAPGLVLGALVFRCVETNCPGIPHESILRRCCVARSARMRADAERAHPRQRGARTAPHAPPASARCTASEAPFLRSENVSQLIHRQRRAAPAAAQRRSRALVTSRIKFPPTKYPLKYWGFRRFFVNLIGATFPGSGGRQNPRDRSLGPCRFEE